ncbi:Calmodulin-binding transcription activator 2 [Melia azedarach]|uniref:Calmodulin-binding transcription activator 2 n=1 Tax=Melia azedarach TaxID=155640 RepID=A0ACC1XWC4_MELAZ|nr:Calmodulin-binding transcription activator 2 [Melia azedarach]
MAETVNNNQLDMEQILTEAQHRWLHPPEIWEILRNYEKFCLSPEPPNRPPSGSLFLFDRKVLRYFRRDGHNWRKKKDGKTVKEAHETIKAGSVTVSHCYYAQGEENENFWRCSYWMAEEELSRIVLVHYLEVKGNRRNANCIKMAKGTAPYFHETKEITPNSKVDSYQEPLQTTDTTFFNSAQTSKYQDHESEFTSPAQADKHIGANDARLTHDCSENLDFPSWEDVLEGYALGVGSQPIPSISSYQPDNLGNVAKQGHEILGDFTNSFGKQECGSLPLIQGEWQKGAKIDSFSQCLSKEVDEESNMQSSSDSYWETVKRENWVHDSSEISFSQWVSKEVGVKESNMESSFYGYWKTVKRENWIDDSSNSAEAHLNSCLLGPSLTQNQLYSIIDFSPNWAFVGSEIKVLITGRFLMSQQEAENCKWACMFGEVEVPAEIVAAGVLRCQTPSQNVGRVPFYITCSNRLACSEVREFEYLANHVKDVDTADNNSDVTVESLRMRFGKLLCLSSLSTPNCDPSYLSDISQLKSRISSLLNEESDDWDQILKLTSVEKFSSEEVQDKLLQKLLKEKLHVWLLQKVAEGGKGPRVLDQDGQGVLHFAAALGYYWAIAPTVVAGVNINFRDVNGWTALHWAAYCGREHTVASLISLGAAPGALSDPTPKYPLGRTPADLAASIGHKGLAGFLSESDLSSRLSAIILNKQDSDAAEIDGAKVVQTVSQRPPSPISHEDLLYKRKNSLAAVCNAAEAAAPIREVFQVQLFQKEQLKEYGDHTFRISNEHALSLLAVKSHEAGDHDDPVHAAAIQIQNKFRSWKGRKVFLLLRQQIIKIQAHVRGHQVRKNYRKIVWSVGIVEKVISRWRQKGSGLRGLKSEALTEGGSSMLDASSKEDDFDFLKEGRKQMEERLQKALARVKSMVQYPEARGQYRRLLNVVSEIQETKALVQNNSEETVDFDEDLIDIAAQPDDDIFIPLKRHNPQSKEDFMEECAQGVGSQPFHPPSSSTQPDTCKQGHDMLGKLYTNSFSIQEEFGNHLQIQGESKGTTSIQSAGVGSESVMDYTNEFTNYEMFKSKQALIQGTREVGRKNGFVIVIKRSDSGDGGQKARITFCCEREGQNRNTGKNKEEKQLRNTSTKKCGCPFKLKGQKLDNDDNWMLKVVCGVHNHPATKPFEGRSYAGRLSKEETSLLIDMSKTMVRPKDILMTLKNRDVNNASTIKQIYNARQRYNKVIGMTERSQMQQLLSKLSEHKYIEGHRSFDNLDVIKDIFWAHPVSIDLLHAFPHILLMDCTYKTNRYNLPLLEIIGVTSTNMTFAIAFSYLEAALEDNYMWALEKLRSIMDDNALPTIILSDKELALMNAIQRVFPTTKHLLGRWHISRNVSINCKKLFAINEIWKRFIMSWNLVVLSSNEDEFGNRLNTLKQEFSGHPQAVEYVTNTWLNNYKERFVSVWTDKIMHFGNLTKHRIGSSHSMVKKQLHHNQGNFETSWEKIHSLLELQHTDIRASFEKSLTVVQDQFKHAEFKELRGFVSVNALHIILSESKRANSIGVDLSTCECIIRRTHGLPCAHEIAKFQRESRPIPLKSIDLYWRKLDLVPIFKNQKAILGYPPVVDLVTKSFDKTDDPTNLGNLKKLIEIADPQFTSLMEPEANKELHGQQNPKVVSRRPIYHVKGKWRSKGKVYRDKTHLSNKFLSSFPASLRSSIHHIEDVAADGNCGFRAIADLMGFGEDGWLQVRMDLLNELKLNLQLYSPLYGMEGTRARIEKLIHALSYFESSPSCERWMIMPDMGHLIASAYNVVLFLLSLQQCLTFLPLRSFPMPIDSRREIAIGFVNNNHFVKVFLVADHPIPPVANNWYKFCHSCAKEWETVYMSRIEDFRKIIGNDVATKEIIDIDSSSFD